MAGLLDDVSILDVSSGMPGALAGMLLADAGAKILRVEPPGGDPLAQIPPFRVWNRGKRSMTLDLKQAEGRHVLERLATRADVLLENFQPGEADRLDIGYDSMHAQFPRLVYVSLTAYGRTGSRKNRPGYEALVNARMGTQLEQQGVRPGPKFTFPQASFGAAALLIMGICGGLYRRESGGKAQRVEVSLEDGVLAMMFNWNYVPGADAAPPLALAGVRRNIMAVRQCGDGKFIQIHTGAPGAFYRALMALGLGDRLGLTPADKGIRMLSEQQADILAAELPKVLMSKPRDYFVELMAEADVACMPVEPPGSILNDPQVAYNKSVMIVDDPVLGKIKTVGRLMMMDGLDTDPRGPAPTLGQHTEAVLKDLGLQVREIEALRAKRVI